MQPPRSSSATVGSISTGSATASGLSTAAIGAIVGSIGAVLVIAIAVAGFVFYYKARLRSREKMLAMTMGERRMTEGATGYGPETPMEQGHGSEALRYSNLNVATAQERDCGRVDGDQRY
jgi:hypothetical protein